METSKALFSKNGYLQTTVPDIVDHTGFSVGTIYNYYQGKEEILEQIILKGWSDIKKNLYRILETDLSAQKKIALLIDEYLALIESNWELVSILIQEKNCKTYIDDILKDVLEFFSDAFEKITRHNATIDMERKVLFEKSAMIVLLGVINTTILNKGGHLDFYRDDFKQVIFSFFSNEVSSS